MSTRIVHLALLALVLTPLTLLAQARVVTDDRWCDEGRWGDRDRERYCEVREYALTPSNETLRVDGGANGGISVEGWERSEILVRAKVVAYADRRVEAEELARDVELITAPSIRAEGPRRDRAFHWSVSYRVFVPRRSNLDLRTTNGGIDIANVSGRIDFDAVNGGVSLTELGGDVHGETTNGGLDVMLTGAAWNGSGLDVRTTNGGVRLHVPSGYNARLETGTVNGGMRIDFPVMVQGRIDRRLTVTLGDGGPLVRATTTNGGVVVRRR